MHGDWSSADATHSQCLVRLDVKERSAWLVLNLSGFVVYLWLDDTGLLINSLDDSCDGALPCFDMAMQNPGTFSLLFRGKYLCAEADGTLVCNKSDVGT